MPKVPRITGQELEARLDAKDDILILDVRNQTDYDASAQRLPGAVRIPAGEVEARLGELDPDREVVAYCT